MGTSQDESGPAPTKAHFSNWLFDSEVLNHVLRVLRLVVGRDLKWKETGVRTRWLLTRLLQVLSRFDFRFQMRSALVSTANLSAKHLLPLFVGWG